jgi:HEAT repeat protein
MMGVTGDVPRLHSAEDSNSAARLVEIGPSAMSAEVREAAISLLLKASESTNPLLRANAIEALHPAPDQIEPVVQRGLADENRGVRFVAAMSVGKLKLERLAPLLEPLLHDESQSVQAAAIYGLRCCRRKADLNPLAAMLLGDDPEVKGNAALVLGELGDPTAIAMLRGAVGKGMLRATPGRRKVVELQIAESMVKLGAVDQIDAIRAAMFAPAEEGELAALACQICGDLKDGGVLADLTNLVRRSGKLERPPEIRMAAALAISQIDPSRTPIEVPMAYVGHDRFELRAQAAHTLGGMYASGGAQVSAVLPTLHKLLNDPNPLVQVSAGGGILRLQNRQA